MTQVQQAVVAGAAEARRAPTIMVVAGEVSGDHHTAGVVAEIMRRVPNANVFGMGGSRLKAAGMELVVDSEKSASVMGLTELFGSALSIIQAFRSLVRAAEIRRPDVAILVDFPDFNLRMAKALKRRGIAVVYFISPQLWAWRRGRIHQIRRNVSKVLPIFPFEEAFYHRHGVDAEYVGHPFLDRTPTTQSNEAFLQKIGLDPTRPVLALLPGSRKSEVERLLTPMIEAFRLLKIARPGLQAMLPVADTLDINWVRSQLDGIPDLVAVSGQAREVLQAGTVGVVASGTATVEAALARIPFVVVYKLSPFSYAGARRLITGVSNVGMVNLIAGRTIVEELLQEHVNGEEIAREIEVLLGDARRRETMRAELGLIEQTLSTGVTTGATCSERVAACALSLAMRAKHDATEPGAR